MLMAIKSEFNRIESILQYKNFCSEIGKKIIFVFINTIILFYNNTKISKDFIHSLIYAYQDYVKLFENHITIDNQEITQILMRERFL